MQVCTTEFSKQMFLETFLFVVHFSYTVHFRGKRKRKSIKNLSKTCHWKPNFVTWHYRHARHVDTWARKARSLADSNHCYFIFWVWASEGAVTCRRVEIQPRLKTRIFQPGLKSKTPFAVSSCVMVYKWKPLLNKSCEILRMKRKKNMEKIVFALSSARTTFSLFCFFTTF